MVLDGGKIMELLQVNAALIVLGGTLGAVMLTTPMPALLGAARRCGLVFFERTQKPGRTIDQIIEYATQARKQGIVSLEQQAASEPDLFLRKALNLAVDGIDMDQIRSIMELEISVLEQDGEAEAKVFESAGGYAPTIGIIGAVLGLIHVMANLSDTSKLGGGIAVAFVATIYGLLIANVICLPIGTKLKIRMKEEILRRVMILEGLIAIQNGENPHFIEQKLMAFVGGGH